MGYGNELEPPIYILCQFLYATLSYHYSFLQRTLDPTDRLRHSRIFQAVTAKHQELAADSCPWNMKPDTPQFTGLPPHVTLLAKFKSVTDKLEALENNMRSIVSDELNKRDIGGGMHHATQILDEIRNVHAEVLEITKDIKNNSSPSSADTPVQEIYGQAKNNERPTGRTLHCYNDELHVLPQNWKLLDMTFQQVITMCLCGDQAKGIPPFHLLKTAHFINVLPRAKHVLCAMRYLMSHVEREQVRRQIVGEQILGCGRKQKHYVYMIWLIIVSNTNKRESVDFMNWLG